jgi:phospholipase/carboxylesterase
MSRAGEAGELHAEFIPAAQKDSRRLMVMLHGLGDSIAGYRWLPEVLDLPWLNYLLANAPDEYYGGYSWYDFAGDMVPGVHRSRQLLFNLLEAQEARGFPSEQTILGGFSQGCLMAVEVGLRFPKRLAGIVGISGYICEPEKLISELSPVAVQQPVLMTHGSLDPMIPMNKVRTQVDLLKQAGVRIEWHEFAKGHTIAGEPEIELIRNFIKGVYGLARSA